MRILFLHGWHSQPGGVKPTFLQAAGHEVLNPALDDDSFDLAVEAAQQAYDQHRPDIVVGSSRGGAVALNIHSRETPLALICPAWKNWGTNKRTKINSVILHSRQDDVIPFAHSEELIANSGLSEDCLIEVGSDHRLADDGSLAALLWACEQLTSGEPLPWLDGSDSTTMTRQRSGGSTTLEEASYICDACGEEIVIPIDVTEGAFQVYVEDCPVCCRANKIQIRISEDGHSQIWAEPEQDHD